MNSVCPFSTGEAIVARTKKVAKQYYLLFSFMSSVGLVRDRLHQKVIHFATPEDAFGYLQGQISLQEAIRRTDCNPRLYADTRILLFNDEQVRPCNAVRLWRRNPDKTRREASVKYLVYYRGQRLCIRRESI